MVRPVELDRELIRSMVCRVRVRFIQRKRWLEKARASGLSLSEWMRLTLDRDARM